MIFNSRSKIKQIKVGNEVIYRKPFQKHLGVIIDEKLNFSKHVLSVVQKAKKKAFSFKAITNKISGCQGWKIQRIYAMYIRPTWEFAPNIWHDASQQSIKKIQSLQQIFLCWSLGTPVWTARYQVNWASKVLPVELRLEEIYIRSYLKRCNLDKKGDKSINTKAISLLDNLGIKNYDNLKIEQIRNNLWTKFKHIIMSTENKCIEESMTKKVMLTGRIHTENKRMRECRLNRIRLDTLQFTANSVNKTTTLCKKNRMKRSHLLFECKKFRELRKRKFGDYRIVNEKRKVTILTSEKHEESLLYYINEVSKQLKIRKPSFLPINCSEITKNSLVEIVGVRIQLSNTRNNRITWQKYYSVYIPPYAKHEDLTYLNMIDTKESLIFGDFNAHSPNWSAGKRNERGNFINNYVKLNNMRIIGSKQSPTLQKRDKKETTPDFLIMDNNIELNSLKWGVFPPFGTCDHSPIVYKIMFSEYEPKTGPKILKRNWNMATKKMNSIDLSGLTGQIKLTNFSSDIDRNYKYLLIAFHKIFDTIAPANYIHAKEKTLQSMWWDKEVKEAVDLRNTYWKTKERFQFEKQRKYVRNLIKRKKKTFWSKINTTKTLNISITMQNEFATTTAIVQ